ncbi:LOB domain-containing protein 21-like [Arachis duranensis]|nr:LOB domain-containing protein 21-like [Arachis duranensis]
MTHPYSFLVMKKSGGGAIMKGYEPRSSSSCAACKFLKRRCIPNCIFAPYFRSDECKKFAKVHKVFGASNVSKILVEVPEDQREDTVNSLAYEAEARLRDPVYGCIGAIALLQRKMLELQHDLAIAKDRLARYSAVAATATADATSLITSSSSSSDNIFHFNHSQVSLPPFPEFPSSSDFNDTAAFCHASSSSSQSFPTTVVDDFIQIPYIF